MELILLKLFAFLRPISWIKFDAQILGMSPFELASIMLTIILALGLLMKAALTKEIRFSHIDYVLFLLSFWFVAIYLVYIDDAKLANMVKLVIPLLTYTVAKNIIQDRDQYLRIVFLIIAGYSIPVVISAALILQGKSIDFVNYFTGLPRYMGAYSGPHNMAHSMMMLIMIIGAYMTIIKQHGSTLATRLGLANRAFLVVLVGLALFSLYMSYVRTVYLGLLVFVVLYLLLAQRKYFAVWGIAVGVGITLALPILLVVFHDVFEIFRGEQPIDQLGSGRLTFWRMNLMAFAASGIDNWVAGLGIGNRTDIMNSHNDYLLILVETGIVGFGLFVFAQGLFVKAILRLEGKEKHLFFSIFLAIVFMTLVSNSTLTRVAVAQIFYILMTYVELPRATRAHRNNSIAVG